MSQHEKTSRRLDAWPAAARGGTTHAEFAADHGMTRTAWRRCLWRARAAGDPRAIYNWQYIDLAKRQRERDRGGLS